MSKKFEEMILVAKRELLFDNEKLTFQGVSSDEQLNTEINNRLAANIEVMRRGGLNDSTPKENNAEINEEYKQPIPYVVIKRGNQVFGYARLSGGGESRLHDSWSLGYGGHANPTDDEKFEDVIMTNLQRELEEELDIQAISQELKLIGLINDDSGVGLHHLGLLYTLELDYKATIEVREKDQIEGFWLNVQDLKNEDVYPKLESWSQFVADLLVK
ncbi:NUDIX domain-containing protein [Priestia flexa]|uniref:NUDIX domain-containing protein n=1 Tax=Priestia flexa TaxID=86664 RepID=UPI000473B533|nr:NUDIX domain-containing protein [Priestia flexa]